MTRLISIPRMGPDFERSKPTIEAMIEAIETGQRARADILNSYVKVSDLLALGLLRLDAAGKGLMQFQPALSVPTFQNGWANYGNGYEVAGYYKDAFGRVTLCGMIASGTIDTTAFTLPAGYRPRARVLFGTISNNDIGHVDVTAGGAVRVFTPSNNTWVSLEGISFLAVQ